MAQILRFRRTLAKKRLAERRASQRVWAHAIMDELLGEERELEGEKGIKGSNHESPGADR